MQRQSQIPCLPYKLITVPFLNLVSLGQKCQKPKILPTVGDQNLMVDYKPPA